jgi:hypothetical protein
MVSSAAAAARVDINRTAMNCLILSCCALRTYQVPGAGAECSVAVSACEQKFFKAGGDEAISITRDQ